MDEYVMMFYRASAMIMVYEYAYFKCGRLSHCLGIFPGKKGCQASHCCCTRVTDGEKFLMYSEENKEDVVRNTEFLPLMLSVSAGGCTMR